MLNYWADVIRKIPVSEWNYAYCDTTLSLKTNAISDIPFSSENPPITIEANVKNISLTNFECIANVAAETGYIKQEDIARLIAFRNNPSDESWIGGNK